jgi:hypothetical protein
MDFSSFLSSLPIMGYGMAGIFIVMGAIFICISALKRISKK